MKTRIRSTPRRVQPRPRIAREDMVTLQIKDFPVDLKRAIIDAAADSNLNDLAVAALARSFKIPFVKSHYISPNAPGDSGNVVLKMPRVLRRRIKNAANDNDVAPREIVLPILRRSFLR